MEARFDRSRNYFDQLSAYKEFQHLDATVVDGGDGGDADNRRGDGGEQMKTVRTNSYGRAQQAGCRPDPVNPPHYKSHPSGVECYQIAEWWPFHLGNALRYLWRVDGKGDPVENLRKATWHLEKEIARRETIARRNWAIRRRIEKP